MKPVQMVITGQRGCIGRALAKWMKANHPEIDLIYVMPFPFSFDALHRTLVSGNVRYMVNCAALGDDAASVQEPFNYYETNCFGVVKQLEMIRRYSPATRYINLGSIYETRTSPYAGSKRCARDSIKTYRDQYGLYALQATLGFTEYPGRAETCLSRKITKGVARIAAAIKAAQPFEPLILRDLDQRYSWTWAEDVVDGIWRMLNQEEHRKDFLLQTRGVVLQTDHVVFHDLREYVLASDETHTVRDFVTQAFWATGFVHVGWSMPLGATGPASEVAYVDDHLVVRLNAPLCCSAETDPSLGDAAHTELGWSPKISFDQLVSEMVAADLAVAS